MLRVVSHTHCLILNGEGGITHSLLHILWEGLFFIKLSVKQITNQPITVDLQVEPHWVISYYMAKICYRRNKLRFVANDFFFKYVKLVKDYLKLLYANN